MILFTILVRCNGKQCFPPVENKAEKQLFILKTLVLSLY